MRTALVAGLLLTIWSLEAHAFCFSPSPPSEPFGSVPGPPFCEVNADYNRCDQFDIDGFKSEIEDYIRKMERELCPKVGDGDFRRRVGLA